MKQVTLRQQLEAFDKGIFLDADGTEDSTCFVFYDWFCSDKALRNKSIKLFKQLKLFVKMKDIDLDNMYVFFKNNCPVNGPLYDDFRIVDIKEGTVQFIVTAKSGHTGRAEIYSRENGYAFPIKTGKVFTDLLV